MDERIFEDLRRVYDAGDLIVFAGAGVSVAAGLPTWKRLAELLRDRARDLGARPEVLQEIEEYLAAGSFIDALSAVKEAIGREFDLEVERQLNVQGRPVPPVARAIAALAPRLKAVLTTNIDRLFERAFEGTWEDFTTPKGDLGQKSHYIWKIHGTLGQHDTWVFSRKDYDRVMFGAPLLQDTFAALYRTHPILFVGFGLADENIEQTLGRVRALTEGQPPSHYALLPESSVGPARRKRLEASGIRLLLYANADGRHAEVEEALRRLAGGASAAPDVAVAPPPADTGARRGAEPVVERSERPTGPVQVVLSFAPEDEAFVREMEKHFALLVRNGDIEIWHEGKVPVGEDPRPAIERRLDQAEVILLLISSDFLVSEEREADTKRAIARKGRGEARVIPVLLRACDWRESRLFGGFTPLPRQPGKDPMDPTPINAWPDRHEALAQIAKEIRRIRDQLRPTR